MAKAYPGRTGHMDLPGGRCSVRSGVLLLLLVAAAAGVQAEFQTLLAVNDPAGDDYGGGTLRYPEHASFAPGVFDLTRFALLADEEYYRFHFEFARIDNPWNAPEGFYHQRIDVFIDARPGVGRTHPLRPGPGEVAFAPDAPWDLWLRLAPWDGARLFSYDDPPDAPGRSEGLYLSRSGERTIEALVPRSLAALDGRERYYVLVGSFDGLGIDGYRAVAGEASEWLLSGATPRVRVVDLLAPAWGPRSQRRQLTIGPDGFARLYPVRRKGAAAYAPWLAALAALLAAGAYMLRKRRT